MSARYPLFLDLAGKRVVVIGAGSVVARRLPDLLASGAEVEVIAPRAHPDVRAALARHGRLTNRRYRAGDLAGAWFAMAATGDAAVDAAVAAEADQERVFCTVAADRSASSAWVPARVGLTEADSAHTREPDVQVAVCGGGDPRRAQAVRDAVADAARVGALPLRRRRARDGVGSVALVGAGPGDPDLLTVRALRLLRSADVVLADHLAPAAPLQGLEPDVRIRYVGKRPDEHSLTQDEINQLILAEARAGNRVVRYKGGDPFVLGRGGEEALACVAAGIPVEVVPGVTSAVSVPAAAGIPVTHRGITSSFVVASAHRGIADLVATAASAPPDATLVLLMGTRHLAAVADELVGLGRRADTPAAIIERGWTPAQRVVTATLSTLADRAARAEVVSPAIVVIGDVVALRERLGDLAAASPDAGHTVAGSLPTSDAAAPHLVPVGPAA